MKPDPLHSVRRDPQTQSGLGSQRANVSWSSWGRSWIGQVIRSGRIEDPSRPPTVRQHEGRCRWRRPRNLQANSRRELVFVTLRRCVVLYVARRIGQGAGRAAREGLQRCRLDIDMTSLLADKVSRPWSRARRGARRRGARRACGRGAVGPSCVPAAAPELGEATAGRIDIAGHFAS